MHIFAYILVILSGMTGLIYQVLWQKQLSNLFGSHQLATSLVLATFFGFMALGYHLIGRWISSSKKNRIWIYGLLEGGIGAYALISPFWYFSLTQYYELVIHWPGSNIWGPIAFAVLLMGLPTFLMGGTIPVLVEGLSQTFDTSHKVHSRIYGLNTLGAFFGTLICGFLLIEKFGIDGTLYLSGFLNIAIFACTIPFQKKVFKVLKVEVEKRTKDNSTAILLGISFLSGFYVFGLENVIIRMAGVSLGSSVYTYTIVVACFILGIAVGAFIAERLQKFPPLRLLWVINLSLVLATIWLYASVPYWPEIFQRVRFAIQPTLMNFNFYWFVVFATSLAILCVPVALMGMNLPLLFFYLKSRKSFLGQTVGRLYAINSVGCVLGAFVGGYLLFNWFSGPVIFKILIACILLTLACLSLLPETKKSQRWIWVSTGLCCLVLLVIPNWKAESFSPGLYTTNSVAPPQDSFRDWHAEIKKKTHPTIFAKYDVNTLVTVTENAEGAKERAIYVNGKPDASTEDKNVRGMNMIIPLMIAPKVENVFIVGLGGGLSLGIATSFNETKNVQVAELSKGVIDALPLFNDYDFNVLSRSEKFQIHNEDAFTVLQRQNSKFDVIVSEPSNPWVSGVEKLFSIEYLTMASEKLSEDGVYVQWFPLFQITPSSFLLVLKNFNSAFKWTTTWTTGAGVTMILASNKEIIPNENLMTSRFNENKDILKTFDLTDPLSVLGRQLLSPLFTRGLPSTVKPTHSLSNPLIAFQSGKARVANLPIMDLETLIKSVIPRPPPPGIPGVQFLFENERLKLSKNFFEDNFLYAKKNGLESHPTSLFHVRRLRYEYVKRHPEKSQNLENFKFYERIVNGQNTEADSRDLILLRERWGNLIPMQIPTKTAKP